MKSVAIVGGGVSGLTAAYHLVELWKGRPEPLTLHLVSQLVPTEGSVGAGLAGKAMSRTFEGYVDPKSHIPRKLIYGPMMPYAGCIPHGYHIVWEYPNLRRMLGDAGDGVLTIDGVPKQVLRPPGGAVWLGAFQGLIDDPAPGGPGIALLGLTDPDDPNGVRTPAAKALLRIRDRHQIDIFLRVLRHLFSDILHADVDPLVFADVFYTHEIDLEMRLAIIGGTLKALTTDPERETVTIRGEERHLYDVEYDAWMKAVFSQWAGTTDAGMFRRIGRSAVRALLTKWRQARAVVALAEGLFDADDTVARTIRAALPATLRDDFDDALLVWSETERVARCFPRALEHFAHGTYPVWRSIHFRFAPDATFNSPFSFDAAQAVRSLAFCYRTPRSARMWSADGQRMQALWLLLWRRLQAACEGTSITLVPHAGRVDWLAEEGEGVRLRWGKVLGHGGEPLGRPVRDLGLPHTPTIDPHLPPPGEPEEEVVDAAVPAFPPVILASVLDARHGAAKAQLAPIASPGNETLELVIWLREPIEYGPIAREALSKGAIGGVEGAFCMIADYSCGLWAPETFAAEDPFETGQAFTGSLVEACGSFADVYACLTRDDAWGWPAWIKEELIRRLSDPAFFTQKDERPWAHDDSGADWQRRRVDGTWNAEREASQVGLDDWIVASRWLVFGYVRQLAGIQSLGPMAVRQFAALAARLDPRGVADAAIITPDAALLNDVRYVVMRNAKPRNRFYNPAAGDWPKRPISGLPLDGTTRLFPAGDWTRNGLDIICMEAATLSGMRAARAVYERVTGEGVPSGSPSPIPVLPPASWYDGNDPSQRKPS